MKGTSDNMKETTFVNALDAPSIDVIFTQLPAEIRTYKDVNSVVLDGLSSKKKIQAKKEEFFNISFRRR